MGTASFPALCFGQERYSGQQDKAPKTYSKNIVYLKHLFSYYLKSIVFHIILMLLLTSVSVKAQDVGLLTQFNGRYDFTFVGNTLNVRENGANDPCEILTSSSATLDLNPQDVVQSAYLYWAGSGTGVFEVKLNGQEIIAERSFFVNPPIATNAFFSAFADVTTLVQNYGNGLYTLSDLDLTPFISPTQYCFNGTNFGGWAMVIVYENATLPLNQINIYDGLQSVPEILSINLTNLNVVDNMGAKIGFVAWEGDRNIAVNETLSINGNAISNPPLNPVNNAFNGTNSITGQSNLYNMDLDVYEIQNNIAVGDDSAVITLTSGQDFVMINCVVTKLNSQLPDATVTVSNLNNFCETGKLKADYVVSNVNSTAVLPTATKIAIYINDQLAAVTQTNAVIGIGGSENGSITVNLPAGIVSPFTVKIVVDDNGQGVGSVTETDEDNNEFSQEFSLTLRPTIGELENITSCNIGFGKAVFNLEEINAQLPENENLSFYPSLEDAQSQTNSITNISNYTSDLSPQQIFVRLNDEICETIASFLLISRNCPPMVYNYVSPNGDGYNDTFIIDGLRDIFLNYELLIYNRWGTLVWLGNNQIEDWDGFANKGVLIGNQILPDGTYFYVLNLRDKDYNEALTGYIYLSK